MKSSAMEYVLEKNRTDDNLFVMNERRLRTDDDECMCVCNISYELKCQYMDINYKNVDGSDFISIVIYEMLLWKLVFGIF